MAVSTPFLPGFPLFSPPGLYWAQSSPRRVTLPGVPSQASPGLETSLKRDRETGTVKASVNLQVGLLVPRFHQWRQVTSFHCWGSVEVPAVSVWGSEPAHPFSNTGPGF